MEACNCVEAWIKDELLMECQYISDFFIAIAYFSIALEIVYFVKKSIVFPHRGVLVQFGAFIVLCGITHLINLLTFGTHTRTVAIIMASSKILTATVSCGTAVMLVHIIPDLLNIKTRELFLKNKADELDHEKGLIRTEEETSRHVRILTHEIRWTLDKHIILNTTLVELGRALGLEECGLWMPTRTGQELQLTYTLSNQNSVGFTVPIQSPTIIQVFNNDHAVIISANSPVAKLRPVSGKHELGEVVAVRIPLLHLSEFDVCDWPELSTERYALMVLILPMDTARRWHSHELELVEAVVDQVAVSLSHAAFIEECMKESDTLMEQNAELDLANREEEMSVRALNDFLVVMNHEMGTHIHAICLLSSLMQETDMTSEIRLMVERILKSSNFLATLKNDASEISCLEDGILQLDIAAFNLHTLFKEVLNIVKPIASVKRLFIALNLASDLPENVIGDEKRLLQVILNIVGNAVKFSKEGSILISAFNSKEQSLRDHWGRDLHPVPSDGHFYLRVQVKDSGSGISPQDIPKLFTKFAESQSVGTKDFRGSGLGLAISKRMVMFIYFGIRIVNLMEGEIGIESKGLGEGMTVNFIVKLGVPVH